MKEGLTVLYSIIRNGPESIFSIGDIDSEEKLQERIDYIGIYYMALSAQGHSHNKGLYIFPVPTPYSSLRGLFYSFSVTDPQQEDKRWGNQRYCGIAIFLTKRTLGNMSFAQVEDKLDSLINKYNTFTKIKSKIFKNKLEEIVNCIRQPQELRKAVTPKSTWLK